MYMETPAQPVNQSIDQITYQEEKPKKPFFASKLFIPIIVGIAILLLTACVGGYLFFKMKNTTPIAITTDKKQPTPTQPAENVVLQDNALYLGEYKNCQAIFFTSDWVKGGYNSDKDNPVAVSLFNCVDKSLEENTHYLEFQDFSGRKHFLNNSKELQDFCPGIIYDNASQKVYFSITSNDLEKSQQEKLAYAVNEIYQLDLRTLVVKLLLSRVLYRKPDTYSSFVGSATLAELVDGKYLVLNIYPHIETRDWAGMGKLIINVDTNEIQSFDDKDVTGFIDFKVNPLNKKISYRKKIFTGRYEECDEDAELGSASACPMYGPAPILETSEIITEDLKI